MLRSRLRRNRRRQLDAAHAELEHVLTALTEARSVAQRSADVSEALSLIESVAETLPTRSAERQGALRELIAHQTAGASRTG